MDNTLATQPTPDRRPEGAPSVLCSPFSVLQGGNAALTPTAEDVAMLTKQYQKALDGLFEAYQFGMMLRAVKARLDAAEAAETAAGESCVSPEGEPSTAIANRESGALTGDGQAAEPLQNADASGDAARGTAREITLGNNGNVLHEGGWNRGTGLKGWLAQFCPEINYSTARRFLAVAEKTVAALALTDEAEGSVDDGLPAPTGAGRGEAPCASAGEGARSPFPPEAKVREFLAGKSQRAVLRLGGARPGAGRKAKDFAAALNAAPEIAWKELSEPLDRLSDLIVRQRRHAVLTPTDLHTLRDAIDLLHEVIHADA